MGLLGFVAGAVAKGIVKNVAEDVALEATDTVARKVLPKDDEGTSIIDSPMMDIDTDSKFDVACVGAGQIIHDTIHPNKPENYKAGIPKVTFHEWQNDDSIQSLTSQGMNNTNIESKNKSDDVMAVPKLINDEINASGSTKKEEKKVMSLPSFTSRL